MKIVFYIDASMSLTKILPLPKIESLLDRFKNEQFSIIKLNFMANTGLWNAFIAEPDNPIIFENLTSLMNADDSLTWIPTLISL